MKEDLDLALWMIPEEERRWALCHELAIEKGSKHDHWLALPKRERRLSNRPEFPDNWEQYLEQHFTEQLSVSDTAEQLSVSDTADLAAPKEIEYTVADRYEVYLNGYLIERLRKDQEMMVYASPEEVTFLSGISLPKKQHRIRTKERLKHLIARRLKRKYGDPQDVIRKWHGLLMKHPTLERGWDPPCNIKTLSNWSSLALKPIPGTLE